MDDTALHVIRSWVGSNPSDTDLETRFDRLTDAQLVALEVLRERRADLVSNPAQFAVSGDYSQSTGKNIDALDADIVRLERLTGTGVDVVRTGVLTRSTGGRHIRARAGGW